MNLQEQAVGDPLRDRWKDQPVLQAQGPSAELPLGLGPSMLDFF